MPKYTGIQVPRDAEVIGRTNRRLKLPFIKPRTDHDHDANARELERWGNQLPFTPGGSGEYALLRTTNGNPEASFTSIQSGSQTYGVHSPDIGPLFVQGGEA